MSQSSITICFRFSKSSRRKCFQIAGQVVQVPNATLVSTAVENLSWYQDRRGRFALLLCPNQSTETLANVKQIVAEAFSRPQVADWQQYLPLAPTSSTTSGPGVVQKKCIGANDEVGAGTLVGEANKASRMSDPRVAAKTAGPTQVWDCGFVEVDSSGALLFEIVFCVPHSDVDAFKRVRHEAFVEILRALERAGVKHSSRQLAGID